MVEHRTSTGSGFRSTNIIGLIGQQSGKIRAEQGISKDRLFPENAGVEEYHWWDHGQPDPTCSRTRLRDPLHCRHCMPVPDDLRFVGDMPAWLFVQALMAGIDGIRPTCLPTSRYCLRWVYTTRERPNARWAQRPNGYDVAARDTVVGRGATSDAAHFAGPTSRSSAGVGWAGPSGRDWSPLRATVTLPPRIDAWPAEEFDRLLPGFDIVISLPLTDKRAVLAPGTIGAYEGRRVAGQCRSRRIGRSGRAADPPLVGTTSRSSTSPILSPFRRSSVGRAPGLLDHATWAATPPHSFPGRGR